MATRIMASLVSGSRSWSTFRRLYRTSHSAPRVEIESLRGVGRRLLESRALALLEGQRAVERLVVYCWFAPLLPEPPISAPCLLRLVCC
jgi:hypothetical protein